MRISPALAFLKNGWPLKRSISAAERVSSCGVSSVGRTWSLLTAARIASSVAREGTGVGGMLASSNTGFFAWIYR